MPSPTPGEPPDATTTTAATTAGAGDRACPYIHGRCPDAHATGTDGDPSPRPSTVSVVIHAQSLAFDVAVVRVPAGARVTATLQNDDPGVEHNLTFGVPGLPHGPTCSGPARADVHGSRGRVYFFLCTYTTCLAT